MNTRRVFLSSLALTPIVPFTVLTGAAADPNTTDDEQDIKNLLFTYAITLDEGRIADCAALFARSDFTIEGVATVYGSDGVAKLFSDIILYEDGTPRTKHIVTNVNVDMADDGSSAAANSYLTVLQRFNNNSLQPIFSGNYRDKFKNDGNGWYFAERVVSGALFGDMSHHLKNPPQ